MQIVQEGSFLHFLIRTTSSLCTLRQMQWIECSHVKSYHVSKTSKFPLGSRQQMTDFRCQLSVNVYQPVFHIQLFCARQHFKLLQIKEMNIVKENCVQSLNVWFLIMTNYKMQPIIAPDTSHGVYYS